MWIKWFPWKFVLKRVALAQGFVDPIHVLSRFNKFAQPSEVLAPVELLRAGAVLHSRGLINSQVIQHNLDWVWPFWAEKQFDPKDHSFIPRAFSITHINLTHRNWTAVGIPGCNELAVVDPRGLVMPYFDSWSLEFWLTSDDGATLFPSRAPQAKQSISSAAGLSLETEIEHNQLKLTTKTSVELKNGLPFCKIEGEGGVGNSGYIIAALRPYNPEGISFIHSVESMHSGLGWIVDEKDRVWFNRKPQQIYLSNYGKGDVSHLFGSKSAQEEKSVICDVGMVTAMALFRIDASQKKGTVKIEIPLGEKEYRKKKLFGANATQEQIWKESLKGQCQLEFKVSSYEHLFKTAVSTLVLHTPLDSYAGPYTYKRFWFRDAAFIVNALLCAGLKTRAKQIIERFFHRQNSSGYFLSQEGEWDSNGQALWAMERYCSLGDYTPPEHWLNAVEKGCFWIMHKRKQSSSFPGLLPAGFSAEHLGPNDHYYWDNFWCVAGLRAGAEILKRGGRNDSAEKVSKDCIEFLKDIERYMAEFRENVQSDAMPASPNRRLDSGAVGSLAVGYPLMLWQPDDRRLLQTANYLFDNCLLDGAFYHDISHSGINPYLSLHIAQVLMRAGDQKFRFIMDSIANLASSTGQWPEAIHPLLKTGCMGDGQHVWAAAEWVMMVRNSFICEDNYGKIVLCQGIIDEYLTDSKTLSFGPAPTTHGAFTVEVNVLSESQIEVKWFGQYNSTPPEVIEIAMPGKERIRVDGNKGSVKIER
ncbi:hypothetical protein QA601_10235 [Chitinispirillales bacterium ANBcel5]|uniref:hypothetical protein n=1 Tax=Cellulosispirillum alkaliphilum TaxID=3039283 RepID=UPI002A4EFE87|nr:hypothetical protein [Chitinispirillales bacterium ANBcel5]